MAPCVAPDIDRRRLCAHVRTPRRHDVPPVGFMIPPCFCALWL